MKRYKMFMPEGTANKLKEKIGEVFEEKLIDEDTLEGFQAKIMVFDKPEEGCDKLIIQERVILPETFYVKILEREREEEEVTVFQPVKWGEMRGGMLRAMADIIEKRRGEKAKLMTEEVYEREEEKKKMIERLSKKRPS